MGVWGVDSALFSLLAVQLIANLNPLKPGSFCNLEVFTEARTTHC